MNPDELRREANRLRLVADLNGARGWENNAESCRRGADALDRMADAWTVYDDWFTWTAANDTDEGVEMLLADISEALRGETNERESSA